MSVLDIYLQQLQVDSMQTCFVSYMSSLYYCVMHSSTLGSWCLWHVMTTGQGSLTGLAAVP